MGRSKHDRKSLKSSLRSFGNRTLKALVTFMLNASEGLSLEMPPDVIDLSWLSIQWDWFRCSTSAFPCLLQKNRNRSAC